MACAQGKDAESGAPISPTQENNTELLLYSVTSWDQFLTPAPLAISLLGQLLIISTGNDFSLLDNAPNGGFKFLRHPKSFCACLVQISNEGWEAFNQAETNMDQIHLYSANVEGHVDSALKFLSNGTKEEINHVLPKCLGHVTKIAKDCTKLAIDIEKKFFNVMNVAKELLEVSTSARGLHERRIADTDKAIETAKSKKETISKTTQEMEEKYKTLEKDTQEADSALKSAWEDFPSTNKILMTSLFQEGLRSATEIGKVWMSSPCSVAEILSEEIGAIFRESKFPASANNSAKRSNEAEMKTDPISKCFQVVNLCTQVFEIATSGCQNSKPYPHQEKVKEIPGLCAEFEMQLSNLSMSKKDGESKLFKICKKGLKICQMIETSDLFEKDPKAKNGINIAQKAKKLQEKIRNSVHDIEPQRFQSQDSRLIETVSENAKFKVEKRKQLLDESRARREKAYEDLKMENEKLEIVIRELAELKPQKVDFEIIQNKIAEGITALSQIRKQWSYLVRFFQTISNIIQCTIEYKLKSFVHLAESKKKLRGNAKLSESICQIREGAIEAKRIAFALHSVAKTYGKVSKMHLMEGISGLGDLIAIDSKAKIDDAEISILKKNLLDAAKKAQDEIKSLVEEDRRQFRLQMSKKKEQWQ